MLLALSDGALARLSVGRIDRFRSALAELLSGRREIARRLQESGALDEATRGNLRRLIETAAAGSTEHGSPDGAHV
jgi:hypothetical protein